MAELRASTVAETATGLDEAAIDQFRTSLNGQLLQPGEDDYESARKIWNGMIDRHPALIVRCVDAADVTKAVNFARDHELIVSVKGGGHNVAGNAVCDRGLMIDLSLMNGVSVQPAERTVRVGPGATLGDVDRETQAYGLATPTGINSTTGIAGLTLGGGFGWLSRKYGFAVDNLLSADVVTANGELVTASDKDNPDLFWGIRGGGGNFGIVTSFQFRLHPVGPEVLSGFIFHPFENAGKVLDHWRSFVAKAPDSLSCSAVLRKAPPLPFLPQEVHGTEVLIIAVLYAGDMKEGERLLRPLREFGDPIADVIGPNPYSGFQQAFDPLLAPGARNYWKSHNFAELSDRAIDTILEYAARLPTPHCELFIPHMGGATNRIAPDATAYAHRDTNFILNVHTRWDDAAQDEECIAWAREIFAATAPSATGGVYVNFVSEGEGREQAAYGVNYDRLVDLKNRYDPTNFFRMNQNIEPKM